MKKAMKGAKVKAMGIIATIDILYYSDYDERDGWDIEFKDTNGIYRHWKQIYDGGEYVPE